MLDLRNVYRKVNSHLHDFTDEQLESVQAIVELYRGDSNLFNSLLDRYSKENKSDELQWLKSRFPDGVYTDVKGLCKVVNQAEIAENDYSLTPGRYVGAPEEEDDGEPFDEKMRRLTSLLKEQQEEGAKLDQQIAKNLKKIGYEYW